MSDRECDMPVARAGWDTIIANSKNTKTKREWQQQNLGPGARGLSTQVRRTSDTSGRFPLGPHSLANETVVHVVEPQKRGSRDSRIQKIISF